VVYANSFTEQGRLSLNISGVPFTSKGFKLLLLKGGEDWGGEKGRLIGTSMIGEGNRKESISSPWDIKMAPHGQVKNLLKTKKGGGRNTMKCILYEKRMVGGAQWGLLIHLPIVPVRFYQKRVVQH